MLLTNTPAPHLVVDLDKYPRQENETRCDYLFVADNGDGWAAPIEITSGVWKTGDKIVEQLQAGAKLAEQIIPPTLSPKLRPVFVGKSKRIKAKESRKLQISFRGQDYPITMCPDGRISKAFK